MQDLKEREFKPQWFDTSVRVTKTTKIVKPEKINNTQKW